MTLKATLLDADAVSRALRRISFEIIERNHGTTDVCLVGIKRRGVCVAKELQKNIAATENVTLPVGVLDITLYRDDLQKQNDFPTLNDTDIPFDINEKTVILCDDVIYTGRTVRAAIDALFSLGRPHAIQFAALVDRGHRELPIKADFVGKNIPTSQNEIIRVTFPEYDDCGVSVQLFAK
ncbi:MAG: bifunctional pyr operon transcriptional regulator/uracil phosphoribosyltransferase PyrR [Clostridia bacterium]|nr:bifunctional pyr operon transcriptional regulator/uracil phosphoribosyltransferase PyrR [Clostridia bacterium]